MVTGTKVFDAKRDKELIAAGTHFWCQGCVIAQPLDDQSPDPRYCQGCYDFLAQEAKFLAPGRRPGWVPKSPPEPSTVRAKNPESPRPISNHTPTILAQPPTTPEKAQGRSKRGRPLLKLPVNQIEKWQEQGLKADVILQRLTSKGTKISRRTLYRILAGQRILA